MKGVDETGVRAVKGDADGRHDKFSPGLDELTGLGPLADRDGAIIALSQRCRWSASRLAVLFGISESRVRRILAEFRAEFGDDR